MITVQMSSILTCMTCYYLADQHQLALAGQIFQSTLISQTCWVAAVLFWRIYIVNTIEVGAHVYCHKLQARAKLPNKFQEGSASCSLTRTLQTKFQISQNVFELNEQLFLARMSKWNWFVAIISTAAIGLAPLLAIDSRQEMMIHLCESVRTGSIEATGDVEKMCQHQLSKGRIEVCGLLKLPFDYFAVVFVLVSCWVSAFNWFRFISGIFRSVQQFEDGSRRLYVLGAMTRQANAEEWGTKQGKLLEVALEEENQGHSVKDLIGDSMLGLTKVEDIEAWWQRKFLQVDFVDKSASMDFAVTMTSLLLLSLSMAALIDWMVHDTTVHPGLLLTFILIGALCVAMLRILEACVATNQLLQRDVTVLANATVEALMPSSGSHSSPQAVQLLFALQKKVEAFDDQQKLFGMPLTANLRNDWVATLSLSGLTALWEFLRPQFKFLSVDAVQDWLGDLPSADWLSQVAIRRVA